MSGIKVQQSRFALLNVDDDDSDDAKQKNSQQNKGNQQKNAQKKKNKKKKQQQAQAENDELKHLAFGIPTKHKGQADSRADHGHTNGGNGKGPQWQEWQKLDEGYAADSFEKDLQQALLLSKLDNEQAKKNKVAQPSSSQPGSHRGDGDSRDKQKKKKDKPQAMSLDQFNKTLDNGKKTAADELDSVPVASPSPKLPPGEGDNKFFEKVEDDVHRILRQEKMQEEYKKQYATESVVTAKYQEQIRKMDKEIEFLRATVKKQEEELKQVKKRNKQLCVILAQGEMKDKAEVLMQVDQLNGVKDELTEQVSELTVELEKERSKAHVLKVELDKYKGGKHK